MMVYLSSDRSFLNGLMKCSPTRVALAFSTDDSVLQRREDVTGSDRARGDEAGEPAGRGWNQQQNKSAGYQLAFRSRGGGNQPASQTSGQGTSYRETSSRGTSQPTGRGTMVDGKQGQPGYKSGNMPACLPLSETSYANGRGPATFRVGEPASQPTS